MGRHVTLDRRRGIAPWLVISAVIVALCVAATIIYLISANRRSTVADCTSSTVLPVAASPAAAKAVRAAAAAFDATKPVARSSCITTAVTVQSGASTAAALIAGWKAQPTPGPALWIADSAADVEKVDTANAGLSAGHSTTPLATSPVVLAVRSADRSSVAELTWKDLPGAADGGKLRVLWVDPAGSTASRAALQSVVAGVTGAVPMTAASLVKATPALKQLAAAAVSPAGATDSTDAALAALAAPAGGDTSVTAVPVLESDLAAYDAGTGAALVGAYPAGPTAGAQILAVPLTASWVTDTTSQAAAAFSGYLNSTAGRHVLSDSGFRVPGTPAGGPSPGIDRNQAVTELPDADATTVTALTAAFGRGGAGSDPSAIASTPSEPGGSGPPSSGTSVTSSSGSEPAGSASGTSVTSALGSDPPSSVTSTSSTSSSRGANPVVTLVVDASSSMAATDAGRTRIGWLQSALTAAISRYPAAGFGLWTVSSADDTVGYRQRVTTGPTSANVGVATRSTALASSIDALSPSGSCALYGAIRAGYADAVAHRVPGRANVVIVVTASTDSTPSLPRATLISAIEGSAGAGVELDIVGLSSNVNSQALTEISAAGNGRFTPAAVTDLDSTIASIIGR